MRKFSALLVVVLLVACVQGLFAAPRAVTMWTFAANNRDEWTNRQADIEKKFGITLNVQLVAQDAFVQKLQAAMLDGKGVPDIIEWMWENPRILSADPAKSLVIPLDPFTKKTEVIKQVVKSRVDWETMGGNLYGLPHDTHPVVLIYNDTLWSKAGVNMAKIKTWDEFFAGAKKLAKEQKDGKPVHYALPFDNGGLENTMFMIWQQTGANILDKNGKPTLDSKEFVAFVKKFKGWYDSGVFTMWDWGNFAALLKAGTLCSYPSPDWWVSQANDASKVFKMKARALPAYKAGGPLTCSWGGSFLGIPKGTADPAFIESVMEYMQYDKDAILKVRWPVTGMIPPLSAVWTDPTFAQADARFGGEKLGQLQISMAKVMPSVNNGDIFWDVNKNVIDVVWPDIITGKISVEDGCKKMQDMALKLVK